MAKDFRPFGDARHKIAEGQAVKSRDIYFALYQTMAGDENRPGLYREYPHDFFDLVIVDECHRGSARDDSNCATSWNVRASHSTRHDRYPTA